jgi:stage III sporulation protein AH
MKKVFKKNRLVILALSVMIAVAGYLNFNEGKLGTENTEKQKEENTGDVEVISYGEEAEESAEAEESDLVFYDTEDSTELELNSDEEDIGEAVLTSAGVTAENISSAKLEREQNRSKTKESLMNIINDESMDEASKESAISSYVALNDNIEKESDAETLLFARGFEDAIVTISDDYVDVALSVESVDDTTRAQIEDIVTRKTGYDVSQVVISVAGSK